MTSRCENVKDPECSEEIKNRSSTDFRTDVCDFFSQSLVLKISKWSRK